MLKLHQLLAVGTAPDAQGLDEAMAQAAHALGFGIASGVLMRGRLESRKALVRGFGNTPDDFVQAFGSTDLAVRDPLMTRLTSRPGFVRYDRDFYEAAGAGDLWEFQAPFGYKAGAAFSLHSASHAEVFVCGVDGPDALPARQGAQLQLEASITLLCSYGQEAMRRIHFPELVAAEKANLEASELEALEWAAGGVSIRRMGDRMKISDADSLRLTASAARKLGATTRTGAALRAIQGGLIKP